MRRQLTIVLFLLLIMHQGLMAQKRADFAYYDSLTYKHYVDGMWKDLTVSSRQAIGLGYDFYYMRMRSGISLFERSRYLQAVKHFRKALEFNTGDPVANEYLYYCFLDAGDQLTANAISSNFNKALREKTGLDTRPKSRFSLDFLYNDAETGDYVSNYSQLEGYGTAGSLLIPVNFVNAGFSISNMVSDKTTMIYGLSYLRKKNLLSYSDGTVGYNLYDQALTQLQFYVSPVFTGTGGMRISPAIHYINTGYDMLDSRTFGMSNQIYSYRVNESNIVTSMLVRAIAGISEISLTGGWSYLNYSKHIQTGVTLILRPLGNSGLYAGGSATLKIDDNNGFLKRGFVYKGLFGFGIADRVWLDFSALYGDIRNFTDGNGYLVYNGVNQLDYILKADITIPLGKSGTRMFLGSRYGSEYTSFIPEGELSPSEVNKNNYKSISLIGGISWLF